MGRRRLPVSLLSGSNSGLGAVSGACYILEAARELNQATAVEAARARAFVDLSGARSGGSIPTSVVWARDPVEESLAPPHRTVLRGYSKSSCSSDPHRRSRPLRAHRPGSRGPAALASILASYLSGSPQGGHPRQKRRKNLRPQSRVPAEKCGVPPYPTWKLRTTLSSLRSSFSFLEDLI